MKHEGPHKLNLACLDCVKVHLEQKKMLLAFVKKIASKQYVFWREDAQELLAELELMEEPK